MAHFAKLDENNVVTEVVVIENSDILDTNGDESESVGVAFCQSLFGGGTWKQTSFNDSMRKNFAGTGFTYDSVRDAFIPPKEFNSWVLNEQTCQWEPPQSMPDFESVWIWDETEYDNSGSGWVEVPLEI